MPSNKLIESKHSHAFAYLAMFHDKTIGAVIVDAREDKNVTPRFRLDFCSTPPDMPWWKRLFYKEVTAEEAVVAAVAFVRRYDALWEAYNEMPEPEPEKPPEGTPEPPKP